MIPERERREWAAFALLLVIGVALMLLAGQAAIRIVPRWQVMAGMDSHIDPNQQYVLAARPMQVEPIRLEILTPPAWAGSLLTPEAGSGTAPTILPVFPAESGTTLTPYPTRTATPSPSPTRTPTHTASPTPTRTPRPPATSTPTDPPPPPRGSITILVNGLPDDGQDFTYAGSLGMFYLDDDADPALSNTAVFNNLSGFTYSVTQALPAGWDLTGIACSDPDGGSSFDLVTRTATIELDPGENITCTFTNTERGTVTITQDNAPDDPQTFAFSGSFGSFSLGDATASFTDLVAGTYAVAEGAVPGWVLTGLSCSDPDGGTTVDAGTASVSLDLDPGETILCTFTNTDRGTVVIVETKASSGSQMFSFTGTWSFNLEDSSATYSGLAAGAYSVVESPATNWSLTGLGCSDPDGGSTVNLGTRTASIDLDAGETVTCTFTNKLTINVGPGDGYWSTIGDGGSLTIPLSTPVTAHGDTGWDFVYYERAAGSGINMDFVIIQLSPDSGATWYTVFNYGGGQYANSNIAAYPQVDNQDIPVSALVGSTGVGIDLYALVSASLIPDLPYNTIRIQAPSGGAGDGCDVDAIEVYP